MPDLRTLAETSVETPMARTDRSDDIPPGDGRGVEGKNLGFFERYLSLWVALCMASGVALGALVPAVPSALGHLSIAQVNLPVAVLVWALCTRQKREGAA